MKRWPGVLLAGLFVSATLFTAPAASAHGGIPVGVRPKTATRVLAAPKTGSGVFNPFTGSTDPAATGRTSALGVGATSLNRGGAASGNAGYGADQSATSALEGWEPWWQQNKDRFLDLRGRLLVSHSASGSPGLLTGRGRKSSWRSSRRADSHMVESLIVPTLLDVITRSDDRDVLDSAVLALARCAPRHLAGEVLDAAIPLLAHSELTVQSSAALSLGVLGSPDAAKLLLSLARDDSTGRSAVGGGPVPRQVRAHAAFALGLVADPRSVYQLLDLITGLPNSERDVRASALAGLGMLPEDHSQLDVIETVLIEMLSDPRLDPMVASFVPTTLAKLGRRGALPALLRSFDDRDTPPEVRRSIALAFGRLGILQDVLPVKALVDELSRGRDRLTRHFSLMSLAQMGSRGSWSDLHSDLARLLSDELAGDGKSMEHRSWAALATALLGKEHPHAQPLLLDRLRVAYANERAPSYKGAFAMALGLLKDTRSAEAIHADFRDLKDSSFRSHAAVALGFLDAIETADELRKLCLDRSTPDSLRLASATALGLLGDSTAVPILVSGLKDSSSLSVQSALANAVGLIGDRSAVEPLLELASDDRQPPLSRAFACVAIGLLAERTSLPFNEPLKADGNYLVSVDSIQELLAIL